MCSVCWRYILVDHIFPIGDRGYCLGRIFFFSQKATEDIFNSNKMRQKNSKLQESPSFYLTVEVGKSQMARLWGGESQAVLAWETTLKILSEALFSHLDFWWMEGLGSVFLQACLLWRWFIDATKIYWGTDRSGGNSVADKTENCLLMEI